MKKLRQVLVIAMIASRSKALNNQTQALLFHQCINHIHSHQNHTLVRNKPKTKTRRRIQQPLKITPRPRNPIPFVTNLKQIHDPEEALSLFHEYHQMGSKHDYASYASLIYKLARARDFEAVETVLGYIQDYNIRCKEILFIALIQHYGKAHLVDKAIELFHKITSFDCVRSLQSLNTLLNVLIDNDRLHDAKEMFGRFHKMGLRPNSVSFNIMIKGWLKEGNWVEARRVFDKMLERKVQPSVVTYNSLIGFLCRKGDVEKAKGLFEDMVTKGKYPNACEKIDGACFILEEMEKRKMRLDLNAWEALVRDACVGDESVDGLDFSVWQQIRDMRFQFSSIHDRYIVSLALPGCESMVVIDLLGNRKMRAGLRYSETPDG
ncbi:hypothetical protein Patl1_30843 [Pistacia atlantica]|uniref:Uncharacterized protein n=1 Tax=Pistacia atlantica TaxID=434234 RepID=A0ACC1A9K0_9ROSI|nr:hypothetical protein Patl1_30843 [Pistacia atlantica]